MRRLLPTLVNARLRAQIVKELLSILRDPRSRLIVFVPPLLQLLVFAFAATLEVRNVNIAVYNHDAGRWSYELEARIGAAGFVKRVYTVHSPQELRGLIDRRDVIAGLDIPSDFSRDITAGRAGTVQVIVDATAQTTTHDVSPVVVRNWFNPNLTYLWFVVPALAGILVFFSALMITALSIARERELGTFWLLRPSLLLFILSVVGIGPMISSVSATQQQAILGASAIGVSAVLMSGFATPVENMPMVLQWIAQAIPLTHFLVIVEGTFLKAMPVSDILANTWPLALIALVTLTMATLLVRSRLQ